MKSIAQEFALDVQERKDRGKTFMWGRFDSDGPEGFDYELDYEYEGEEKYWSVNIDSIQRHNEMGDVCGWYTKKQLEAFIIEANDELNKVGL
jgi:hypothetical protein